MLWIKRISLLILKIFVLLVVTMMIRLQMPELRYDFGAREPLRIESAQDLPGDLPRSGVFVSVRGTADFSNAATYASHGVPYTYFLLEEYGPRLVVRSPELVDETWKDINAHIGRLRPYHGMPFSRSVRSGFQSLFGVTIADNAFSLARDDVPQPNGWSIGALVFASILWGVLAYFFFVRPLTGRRKTQSASASRQDDPLNARDDGRNQ